MTTMHDDDETLDYTPIRTEIVDVDWSAKREYPEAPLIQTSVFIKYDRYVAGGREMLDWLAERASLVSWRERSKTDYYQFRVERVSMGYVADFKTGEEAVLFALYWA